MFKNKNNISFIELLCGVIVFGGFLFHAIWETKAVNLYQYYLLLLPYAAKGLYNISAKCLRFMDGKVD